MSITQFQFDVLKEACEIQPEGVFCLVSSIDVAERLKAEKVRVEAALNQLHKLEYVVIHFKNEEIGGNSSEYGFEVLSDGRAAVWYPDEVEVAQSPSIKVVARKKGIFLDGEQFDAWSLVSELFLEAATKLQIVDAYIGKATLDLLAIKKPDVQVEILARKSNINSSLKALCQAFNKQYGGVEIRNSDDFHDRFLIIDEVDFYHLGASIKDAGGKVFMFSRFEEPEIIQTFKGKWNEAWGNGEQIIP